MNSEHSHGGRSRVVRRNVMSSRSKYLVVRTHGQEPEPLRRTFEFERLRESCAMRMHLKNSVIYYDLHLRFEVAIDRQRQLEVPIYPYYQRSYTVASHG